MCTASVSLSNLIKMLVQKKRNGSHSLNSDHFQAVKTQKTNFAFFLLKVIITKVADVASLMSLHQSAR